MKKIMVLLMIVGLVAASLAAPASARKRKKKHKRVERKVEVSYDAPAIGVAPPGNGVCLRPTNSCGDIATGATEKFLKLEIADATGLPVAFSLGQDTDPNELGTEKDLGDFCGTTGDEAIEIDPGYPIVVFPWAVGAACASIATQGTVTATLSNLP